MLDTVETKLSSAQQRDLERFGSRVNKFGANFAVYGADDDIVLLCEGGRFESERQHLIEVGRQALNQEGIKKCRIGKEAQIFRFGERNQVLAAILRLNPALVALVDLGVWPIDDSMPVSGRGEPYEQLAAVFGMSAQAGGEYLVEMLQLLAKAFWAEAEVEEQIEMVSTELAQTYEELVLLHKLSVNMKVTEADANFLQMACDSLTDIVNVEGIAILLEKTIDGEKQLVVAAGSGLIDMNERMMSILHSRLEDEISNGKEMLLDSEFDSPFKYEWQDNVKSIIAVPLYSTDKSEPHLAERTKNGNHIIGLMVAINRIDKEDFDSTDAKLFDSVANGCAVFIENGRLFKDLEELFIGSLRALTRSIDAKDNYTRGHSERVAFIARWIAERLGDEEPLEEEQLHKIYLAGLLHDIGKIGIDEVVLRKQDELTEEEMECIRKHPSIGAGILREVKRMHEIVPGVLHHHERIDGKGYPDGLVGDEIPLIGKIVGLADSFDAITSRRAYRSARTVEQAIEEIEKGLGTQFDEKIGRVFINSDVYLLWDIIMQNRSDFGGIYDKSDVAEYGTAAVGTLVK